MAYCDYCESDRLSEEDVKTCSRIECEFQWIMTETYMDCPVCELRELKLTTETA